MAQHQPLNAQCFVKHTFQPFFVGDNNPQLLYVCNIRPEISQLHPRVMHAHDDLVELVLIYNGSGNYLIDNKRYNVRTGDLLIFNSGVVHDEYAAPDSELGFYTIAVGGLHMPGLRPDALISDDMGCCFPTGPHFDDLRQLLQIMFRCLSTQESNAESFCYSLMHALLSKVRTVVNAFHEASVDSSSADEIDDPNILGKRIKDYIDHHYMEQVTLQTLADVLHASPYYISHVFKDMCGYSPIQYLLRRRIGEAQTLLITTDLSITQIAEMVGYDTQSYFNMQFTKNVGMPPKKFRQNYIVSEQKKRRKKRKDESDQ